MPQIDVRKKLQHVASEKAGVNRDKTSIDEALIEFVRMREEDLPRVCVRNKDRIYNREWVQGLELNSMLTILEMVCRTSLNRTESRGALYRRDYPETDNVNWLKNQIVKKTDEGMQIWSEPVVITKLDPPKKIMKYGQTD